MERLEEKIEVRKGDIIDNVEVIKKGYFRKENREFYVYKPKILPDTKGIIDPKDDVIFIGQLYSVIVNKVIEKKTGRIILSEIYYDFEDLLNDTILVKISGISKRKQPTFQIHGYRGFVVKGKAKIGDRVRLKTLKIISGKKTEDFLKTKIISYLR